MAGSGRRRVGVGGAAHSPGQLERKTEVPADLLGKLRIARRCDVNNSGY